MPLSLDEIEDLTNTSEPLSKYISEIKSIYEASPPISLNRAKGAFLIGNSLIEEKNHESALVYYSEVLEISKTLKDEMSLADALHGFALVEFRNGNYKEVNRLEERAVEIAIKRGHPNRIAVCYGMLGSIAQIYCVYEQSTDYLMRTLQIAKENGFFKIEVRALIKLSEICLLTKNYKRGKNYAEASLRAAQRQESIIEIQKARLRLAAIERELEHYDEVLLLIDKIQKDEAVTDPSILTVIHTLQAKVHQAYNHWEDAEKEFERALSQATYPGSEMVRSNIHAAFSQFYYERKLYKPALREAEASLIDAEKSGHVALRKDALHVLRDCYKALGDFTKAYQCLEEYNELISESDKQLLESRLEFHELRYDYEAERAASEAREQKADLLRIELERKDSELIEKTKHLIKQTESLAQFREDLKAMVRRLPASDPMVQDVRQRLKDLPEEQLHWKDFDAQFNSVHPEFLHNLTKAFPDLTPAERKICPLLRLNLETEEIAKLLFVSDRNIENHRYRIRKKLGLATSESLQDVLGKY